MDSWVQKKVKDQVLTLAQTHCDIQIDFTLPSLSLVSLRPDCPSWLPLPAVIHGI